MAKDTKSFVLLPKPARGIVTSRSAQVLGDYTDSLSFAQNLLAKDGSWICRGDDTFTDLISGSAGPVHGIHYYNAIDTSNAAATPQTIYLMHAGQATNETGTSTLRRSDTGAIVTVNGVNFTTTTPSDIFFLNIKNRCFVAGNKMGTSVVPTIVSRYPQTSYQWGVSAPTANLTYDAYTNVTNTTTKVYYHATGASVTATSNTVNRNAGTWDTTNWDGKTILTNDVAYDLVDVTGASAMTISPAWVDDGLGAGPNITGMRVQYGEVSWPNAGPQYAYAYYNPSTGHISSMSPITQISEQSLSNVRVKLSNIMLTNDANYTRVVIFRTAFDNGGILLPLKLEDQSGLGGSATVNATDFMIENTSVGAVTYVDKQPDSMLGQILGGVQGPTTNNPPPADIRYMAYWDQRVWVVSAASRNQLQFSGNAVQIPLGVAEESFPALNVLPIPGDDGLITGLRVVGTSLLVCTERYLYFVDASTGVYRLTRISSRGGGVDQYAIDEHPGDSTMQSASALYVSRDKRLWRQFPGGRIDDIGWPIQDKLDNIDLNRKKPVIVRVAQVDKSWFLVLGIRESGGYGYLFYDFDEQCWLDFGFGTTTMWTSSYDGYTFPHWSGVGVGVDYTGNVSGKPSLDIGNTDASGTQRIRLMGTNTTGTYGLLATQELDLGDKQAKKTLQDVIIHTDQDDASIWDVFAFFDGGVSGKVLQAIPDTAAATSPRYMGIQTVRFVPTSDFPAQFHTVKLFIRCLLDVGERIHKLVANYTIESTGASGSQN